MWDEKMPQGQLANVSPIEFHLTASSQRTVSVREVASVRNMCLSSRMSKAGVLTSTFPLRPTVRQASAGPPRPLHLLIEPPHYPCEVGTILSPSEGRPRRRCRGWPRATQRDGGMSPRCPRSEASKPGALLRLQCAAAWMPHPWGLRVGFVRARASGSCTSSLHCRAYGGHILNKHTSKNDLNTGCESLSMAPGARNISLSRCHDDYIRSPSLTTVLASIM